MREPPLVQRAVTLARQLRFPLTRDEAGPGRPSASLPDVGRFLAVLAAGCTGGRIAEGGTGVGIGAAWIASMMPADCELVTVEIEPRLAAAAQELFAGDDRVKVRCGDAREMLAEHAPYDLVFADGGFRRRGDLERLLGFVRPGGRIVMDDVTPLKVLSPESRDGVAGSDAKRSFFFGTPGLISTEVVLPDLENSLLVGTRLS